VTLCQCDFKINFFERRLVETTRRHLTGANGVSQSAGLVPIGELSDPRSY
jgi:hypothetical protein